MREWQINISHKDFLPMFSMLHCAAIRSVSTMQHWTCNQLRVNIWLGTLVRYMGMSIYAHGLCDSEVWLRKPRHRRSREDLRESSSFLLLHYSILSKIARGIEASVADIGDLSASTKSLLYATKPLQGDPVDSKHFILQMPAVPDLCDFIRHQAAH